MVSFKKSLVLFGVAIALGLSIPVHTAHAAPADIDPACDTDFMAVMKDRAWMEAQRETMITQSIIAKPDSVFDLTCFGNRLSLMYGSLTKLAPSGDNSQSDISSNIGDYLGGSFGHALGGGHATSVSKSLNSANCKVMGELWQAAKCTNVSTSGIMDLKGFSSTDTRAFAMSNCSNTGAWSGPITKMKTVGLITTAGGFDKMDLFAGVTAPLSQTGSTPKCSPPIKTGVLVGANPEVVCPNPGCSPTGGATPKCCKTGTTSTSCN